VTDSLDFEHVLNICLDRLQEGDTPQACLASYPSHASRLAPLLRVAALLETPDIEPMPAKDFRAGQARFLAHAAQLRARRQQVSAPRPGGILSNLLGSTRRLVVASMVSVLLLCGVLSAGTVSAASASLPGSRLYPVKRTAEALVSSVAFTPRLQTRVHLAWADRRLREVEALMARDGVADEAALAALEQETEQALAAAEQADPDQLIVVVTHTQQQQEVLGQLLDKAPPAARPGLERALAASAQGQARAQSALEQARPGRPAASPGPPITPPGKVDKEPPDTGQGQGVGPASGKDTGPGRGQGQDQDQAGSPNQGQSPGHGQDKDEQSSPDNGKGQGKSPDPGKGSGQGNGLDQGRGQNQGLDQGQGKSDGKPDKVDNPGRGQEKK
jgi:hypothetical protein